MSPTDGDLESRWRALWQTSAQRSPFSHLVYVRASAEAAGLRVGIHFVDGDDGPAAAAAVTWRRRGPYREVILPPFTPHSALLLADTLSESDVHRQTSGLDALLAELEAQYDAVNLQLSPTLRDVRTAQWRGWKAQPLYTYYTASASRSDWSSSTARNFRRARQAYDMFEGNTASAAVARLVAESYTRHDRKPPLAPEAASTLVGHIASCGLGRVFGLRNRASDEVEAAVAVVHDDDTAYYWMAGSRPGDAMTVLVGELLERLFSEGIKSFDFVGANTPSIAEFKRRFGAKLVPYFRLSYSGRAELKLLYMFRKMWR